MLPTRVKSTVPVTDIGFEFVVPVPSVTETVNEDPLPAIRDPITWNCQPFQVVPLLISST